jgi:hypothetical protein
MPKHHIPCATLASATILLFRGLAAILDVASGPCHLAAAEPAHTVRLLLTWGKKRSQPGEFDIPIGIAITRGNEILVTDADSLATWRRACALPFVQQMVSQGQIVGTREVPAEEGAAFGFHDPSHASRHP